MYIVIYIYIYIYVHVYIYVYVLTFIPVTDVTGLLVNMKAAAKFKKGEKGMKDVITSYLFPYPYTYLYPYPYLLRA